MTNIEPTPSQGFIDKDIVNIDTRTIEEAPEHEEQD